MSVAMSWCGGPEASHPHNLPLYRRERSLVVSGCLSKDAAAFADPGEITLHMVYQHLLDVQMY